MASWIRISRPVVAALTLVSTVGACTSRSSPGSLKATDPGTALVSPNSCSPQSSHTVRLGGTGAELRGNPAPVRVTIPNGSTVRVSARFGERELTFPAAASSDLRILCQIREGWTYTTFFRAQRIGAITVESHTSTCPPCAQLAFKAHIVVTRA